METPDYIKLQGQIMEKVAPHLKTLSAQRALQDKVQASIGAYNKIMDFVPVTEAQSSSKYLDAIKKIAPFTLFFDMGVLSLVGQMLSFLNYDFRVPIELEEDGSGNSNIIIDETSKVKRIITDIYRDNKTLLTIESREFEEVIAELLAAQGFKVELTKQTRDNGFDIIALKYMDGHFPLKFLVECKRYTKQKVGVEIIRSFKDVILTEKANRGIIVTTSYFTKDATKKQQETPYLLEYKDKDRVIEWVNEYSNK